MKSRYPNLAGFLNYDVNKCILPDLKRLREDIRPDRDLNALRGCTVATAMFAFAIIDFVGFLMRPSSPTLKQRDDTYANMTYQLCEKAGVFPGEYQLNADLLIKLFRHGLMHQVFPKASGIAKVPKGVTHGLIFYQPKGPPILNVDKLVDDLILALRQIAARVQTQGNDDLARQMDAKIRFLQEEDQQQLEDLRRKGLVEPADEATTDPRWVPRASR